MMKLMRHATLATAMVAIALPGIAMASPAQGAGNVRDAREFKLNVQSQRPNRVETLYAQRQPQRRISASQAKAAAMNWYRDAKFINVQLANQNTYRVRLQQKNGRIVDVYVDAYTGQVKN